MDQRKVHPIFNVLLVAVVLFGLYIGQSLLVPLVMAIVVWYLIIGISSQIGRIKINQKQIPKWLRKTLSILVVVSFFWFIGGLVVSNLEEFHKVAPDYNNRLQTIITQISTEYEIPSFQEVSDKLDLAHYAGIILNSSLSFLGSLFVVIFYVIFLMIEQGIFKKKLDLIFRNREQRFHFSQTVKRIDLTMKKYISVKSLLSLLVSVCAYITFESFGLDFAVLWAFLAFLLNFIPFIGSFIAIVLPTLLSILQFGSPAITISMFIILNTVQVIVGNYLEPKMVGKSLNLSPLVVVLSLAFWGALWGVAGMFLCVPITVALMIILSQFESTRTAAILLSAGNDPALDVVKVNDDRPKSQ
ncbi:AI-2E family transporter [Paracrocinitomix mangrovi]|uniref:AI-2E family transporter n=1 Tax=Paracrocinitomix mangrovi TaxID=2862509 RepID=UPI001C8E5126|nr:AI-2E family transporter [Paracrocinitomix mangrovi]UKN02440.1 AI-2E family transporter [Paracrocinitomix mangrovi]